MWNSSTQRNCFEVFEKRNDFSELISQAREILVKFIKLWSTSNVRVEHHHLHPGCLSSIENGLRFGNPNAMLRARSPGITFVHVTVPKAGIHPQ